MGFFNRIGYFGRETFLSIGRNVAMNLACVITIFISLLLVGGSIVWIQWVNSGNEAWKRDVGFEIFMNVDATETQVTDMRSALETDPDVASFTYLSKDDAYAEFQEIFADEEDLVASTEPEFLPESFRAKAVEAERLPELVERYQTRPGVDAVADPSQQVQTRLRQARVTQVVLTLVALALLISAVILVVFTVRLATLARRREIEVMKLVGASNWFVRVPFMAEGGIQGFTGAALAALGTGAVAVAIPEIVDWQGGYSLSQSAVILTCLGLVVVGTIIGIGAAFVGLVRYLDV